MNAEKDKQLIALVKEARTLYDPYAMGYGNKHARNVAWTKISQELKIPVVKCSKNWYELRSRFLNALIRRRSTYRPITSWTYETEMEFIVPFLNSSQLPDLNVKCNGNIIKANTPTQNSAFGMNLKVEIDEQNELDEILIEVKEELLDLKDEDTTLSVNDDIDLFFENLSKSVKKLPREEQIKVKLNFQSTLSEIELKLMLSKVHQ